MTGETPTSTRARAPEPPRRPLVPSLTPAVVTTRGRRETNQDRVCALRTLVGGEPAVLLAVADGIGGLPAGEQAADLALQVVGHYAHYVLPESEAERSRPPRHPGRPAPRRRPPDLALVARPGPRRRRRQHARVRPRLGPPLPGRSRRRQPLLLREPPRGQLSHARPHRSRAPRPGRRAGARGGAPQPAQPPVDERPRLADRPRRRSRARVRRAGRPRRGLRASRLLRRPSHDGGRGRHPRGAARDAGASRRPAGGSSPSPSSEARATTSAWPRSRWDTSAGRLDLSPDPFVDWRTALSSRG